MTALDMIFLNNVVKIKALEGDRCRGIKDTMDTHI